ncbi:hypothetical protein [Pedobacter jamesrossensis]|uniref:SMI1/KNR4 family protein n=1 Tax=Pedobacter jamesrossensis TaxID=1908238 RepID=A0ABV8NHZ7_9SPHI
MGVAYHNKSYLEEKEETLKNQQEIADKKSNPKPLPFTEMVFEGITFKVINLAEADALIGNLTDFKGEQIYNVFEDTWRFPSYQENCFFLLTEEDVTLEKLDLDYSTEENSDVFILGFIFLKNLKTDKYILACDTDNSPALIVLGNVETVNIHLFGNVHYIGDGLQCDTLWAFTTMANSL